MSRKLLLPRMVCSRPFQTVSLPARPSQNSAIQRPIPPKSALFFRSLCAGIGTSSVMLRKSDLHFLCNRKPLHFHGVLLEEGMHSFTWWAPETHLEVEEGRVQRRAVAWPCWDLSSSCPVPASGRGWWAAAASAPR